MPINEIVLRYQTTKCEKAFCEIYEYIYEGGFGIVSTFSRRYKLDELDVESMINEKLLDIATKFDGQGKFKNAVYSAIKFGCIDLARKRTLRDNRTTEVMYEDDDGILNEVYEIIEVAPTTEDDEIKGIKKRDQRQLVTFLLSNANELTLTSASAFIETDSYRKAAKQIGTTDKTVKSRIRNLSKHYDESIYGSYYDYFTAPTVHVG
ncbi:sigma-70 family RNA polymerase sigma factor [Psychrobacillus sp. OK032]|uniref:sigma-70 family RNA polymerase sigma factor n=1 Tax=Psychrobacillus sp. OK032 TaxID=1884358 RepID=UPI0008C8D001|nr:sigma-70 family RNA polymerase sigma factor [Psychrobacillus sp. OK032]SER88326.1 RNA polymerase sigma factor, sigma-70 family [Psychrobacillus sp. OK032]